MNYEKKGIFFKNLQAKETITYRTYSCIIRYRV